MEVPGVALITGAASGIGRGTALAFAEAGCRRLCLGDVNIEGLDKTRGLIQKSYQDADVQVMRVDISNKASVSAFVDHCVYHFGRIDYACNIAGIVPPRTPVQQTSVETFDKVADINTVGTYLCHRAQINQMLRQEPDPNNATRGCIVSASSLAGLNASPGASPYSGSKFAIIGMVKSDALVYAKDGIRVNAVCPGFTDTEALHAISTAEQRSALARTIPIRRLGNSLELGRAFVYLASDYASYVNGTALTVDGGALLDRGN